MGKEVLPGAFNGAQFDDSGEGQKKISKNLRTDLMTPHSKLTLPIQQFFDFIDHHFRLKRLPNIGICPDFFTQFFIGLIRAGG